MNSYFFYDLEIPIQSKTQTSSIRKQNMKPNPKKRVTFKPTEIFGRDAILPNCVVKYGRSLNLDSLHSPHCPNFQHETPEVLGQYSFMNRKFLIECRYKTTAI